MGRFCLTQVHKDREKRCLTIGGHKGDDLIHIVLNVVLLL